MSECIILFGFKASGKTYLGKKLSAELNRPFIDTDYLLEQKFQAPVRDLYERFKETFFRKEESIIIQSLEKNGSIISVGGGAILNPQNLFHLQTIGELFYIDTPFEIIWERILKEGIPSFVDPSDPFSSLQRIYHHRKKIYESIAAKKLYGV